MNNTIPIGDISRSILKIWIICFNENKVIDDSNSAFAKGLKNMLFAKCKAETFDVMNIIII